MPYTSHGHWYGPGPVEPSPRLIAKCFGLNGCADCRQDAGLPPLPTPRPVAAQSGDTTFGLLRDARDLLDALDLGVESDGVAAMVSRINAHLARATQETL